MKRFVIFCYITISGLFIYANSYKFKIDSPLSEISIDRSTASGSKMVKVIAYGRSADKAIDRAMLDAVVAATFHGLIGNEFIESMPPILVDGLNDYKKNKKFFDTFFKKGDYLSFVSKVNTTYPTGTNNVSTKRGRKITIYLIINWKKLDDYFKSNGFLTQSSLLNF